jgi:phosphoglycolate phosphatase-like HAD superfamily hydrolase
MNESRLILFDIDGTLLSARGIPRKTLLAVLHRRYPGLKLGDEYRFDGRTDWEIVAHLLRAAGLERETGDTNVLGLLSEFSDALEAELKRSEPPLVFPGVRELLEELAGRRPDVCLGLVTGNTARGAQLKLGAAGLASYFPVGGFGSDAMERAKLPPIAVERAERFYGFAFAKENIWIVGDNVFDIRCAHENGLKCLIVCTGHSTRENLAKESPEALVDDFRDTRRVLALLGVAS